jgi:hypothetical protein
MQVIIYYYLTALYNRWIIYKNTAYILRNSKV